MRRTLAFADALDVTLDALRTRFQATDGEAARRTAAPLIELLPIVPFMAQLSFMTDSDSITPLWPLAMVAGLGWILVRRWRIGLGFAFVRLAVLYLGLMALIYTSLADTCQDGDPRCIDSGSAFGDAATPLLWGLCAFYVVVTLGSAYLVSRTVAKDGPAGI